jgi:hypothetical protein
VRNKDFRDIVRDSWPTLDKPDFRNGVDRVGAAVGTSTAVGKWRDLVALAEFAAASATPADFAVRFSRGGSASEEHRAILRDIQKICVRISLLLLQSFSANVLPHEGVRAGWPTR